MWVEMSKKTEQQGIPLETLFTDEGFKYHYYRLMQESAEVSGHMQKIVTDELIACASDYVKNKQKNITSASKGGKETAKTKQEENKDRNSRIVKKAKDLLQNGNNRREVAGILSNQFNLSARQINNILKKEEV